MNYPLRLVSRERDWLHFSSMFAGRRVQRLGKPFKDFDVKVLLA